jgi:hypothetical protein
LLFLGRRARCSKEDARRDLEEHSEEVRRAVEEIRWDAMLLMIAAIVEKCKDKDEILAVINKLVHGKGSAEED